MKKILKLSAVFLSLGLLAACGDSAWFGGEKDKTPLPGNRISVLSHEKTLVPDPGSADKEIKLPRPEDSPEWPMAGGYPNHAMHHMTLNDVIKKAWKVGFGDGSSGIRKLLTQPVVAEGKVFTMDVDAKISAFNEKNGKKIWQAKLTPKEEDDDHMGGGVAYENGRIFVSTGFAQVIALNADNGKEIWRKKVPGPVRAAPTVRAGKIFVVTADNQTLALDAEDGKTIWNHSGIGEAAGLLGGASPAADQSVVVVPYSSGELFALKIENGSVAWSETLTSGKRTNAVSTMNDIVARPVIDRGKVYAIGNGDIMLAIDLRTGRRLWDLEIGGTQSMWIAGNYLYVISNNSELVCVDAKQGKIVWISALQRFKSPKDKKGPITWAGPILAGDRLIVTSSLGWAIAVSPYTGKVLGYEELPDGVTQAPAIANSSLYFQTEGGDLVAFR